MNTKLHVGDLAVVVSLGDAGRFNIPNLDEIGQIVEVYSTIDDNHKRLLVATHFVDVSYPEYTVKTLHRGVIWAWAYQLEPLYNT